MYELIANGATTEQCSITPGHVKFNCIVSDQFVGNSRLNTYTFIPDIDNM
eukprot:m.774452 g.774452  ORF g.774452 m.774452 type:complete len:50 (-) comp23255_c0_seq24:4337-4486(-)